MKSPVKPTTTPKSKAISRFFEVTNDLVGVEERKEAAEPPQASDKVRTGMAIRTQGAKLEAQVQALEIALDNALKVNAATMLSLDKLEPNPWQPRRKFDEAQLHELRDSIIAAGRVLQPIAVRAKPNAEKGSYQIIAGERRYRASQLAGKPEIPAVVLDLSDADMAALALAENVVREDLSDFEIGMALASMESQFPSKIAMCETFGIQRSQLYRLLSFSKLPQAVISRLELNPFLMGATLAEAITSSQAKCSDKEKFEAALLSGITKLETGSCDQTNFMVVLEKTINPSIKAPSSTRLKNTLMQSGEKVGTVSDDGNFFAVKIKAAHVSEEQKIQIKELLQKFFVAV